MRELRAGCCFLCLSKTSCIIASLPLYFRPPRCSLSSSPSWLPCSPPCLPRRRDAGLFLSRTSRTCMVSGKTAVPRCRLRMYTCYTLYVYMTPYQEVRRRNTRRRLLAYSVFNGAPISRPRITLLRSVATFHRRRTWSFPPRLL